MFLLIFIFVQFDIVIAVSEDLLTSSKLYHTIIQTNMIVSYPNGNGGRNLIEIFSIKLETA
jgi:hypothetical protein